jgi:thioredoxin-dependent peroxiredoxin
MLAAGTTAPEFTLPDQDGQPVSLSSQRGHWVVLWWYRWLTPRAERSTGQGLRDQAAEFEQLECVVLGASFDHTEANGAFRQKFDFPFRLLSDWDEQVGVTYEVRGPGTEKVRFAKRLAYLIDAAGDHSPLVPGRRRQHLRRRRPQGTSPLPGAIADAVGLRSRSIRRRRAEPRR